MQDEVKTKEQLLAELHDLRNQVSELKKDRRKYMKAKYWPQDQLDDALDPALHFEDLVYDPAEARRLQDDLHRVILEQRAILDTANVAISLVRDRKQVWINRKTEEMFQYSRDEMVGQTTRKLYPSQEAYERLGREAYPVLSRGLTYETVQELKRRDGSRLWVKYNGRAIDPPDLSLGTLWILEDITERKLMEESLKRAHDELELRVAERTEKLERVNEELRSEIAERERVEEALRQKSDELQLILDTVPASIWFKDRDNKFLRVNKATCRMMGIPAAEIEGKHASEVFPDWLAEKYYKDDLEVIHSKQPKMGIEEQYVDAGGRLRWVNTDKLPWFGEQGNLACVLAFAVDITERKRAEAALAESEQRFKLLYERAPLAYQSLDEKGNFIEVNQAWLDTLGYEREDVLGRNFGDFLHLDWIDHFKENFPRFKAIGEVLGVEFQMVKKDGSTILVSFHGKIGKDIEGRFQQTHCIFQNITRHRLVEDALRESERRFRSLFENSPVAYQSLDIEGRFIDLNQKLCDLLGYQPEDLIGRSFGDLWSEATRDHFPQVFETFKTNRQVSSELHLICRDGREIDVILEGRVQHDKDGNFIRTHCILTDITELKRAQEEASIQRDLLAKIFENAPFIMMLVNPEGRVVNINRKGVAFTGKAKEELLGFLGGEVFNCLNSYDGLGCGKNAECADCPIRSRVMHTFSTGESIYDTEGTMIIRTASGDVNVSMLISTTLVKDRDFMMVLVTIMDITERKRTERALRESEATARTLLNIPHAAAFLLDRNGICLDANETMGKRFSKKIHEIIGKSVWDLFPYEVAEKRKSHFQTILRSKRQERYEDERDGHWNDSFISPILDENDEVSKVAVLGFDITERKLMEQSLRESEERLRTLINSTPDIVCFKDAEGRWLEANDAYLELFDLLGVDYKGKKGSELAGCSDFYREVYALRDASDERAWQEYGLTRNEEAIPSLDGTVRFYDVIKVPLFHWDGQRKGLVVLGRDITERKQAEEEREKLQAQLAQAQKIESVGRLAGGVAHDFNNMLGVIIGHADMLLDEIGVDNPVLHDVMEMRKAAERSADLTRQLLTFARKQTISPKVLDLNETVSGILKMLRRLIGEDISLAWKPGMDIWPVKMDPSQIDQILANLAVNARDAMTGVGSMTIETANVVIDSYCDAHNEFVCGSYVMLSVSDNGCGMDRETLAHIFEPFFTTKEVGKGTGLGLATVYGVVKQNSGFINVYSEIGQGTTFKIYLPRAEEPATEKGARDFSRDLRGTETVLLVEDEEPMLTLGKRILERHGYEVLAASRPLDALRMAQKHPGPIHLLITDVVMPEMNGKDLKGKLSEFKPGFKTIFMSGYTADVIAHHGVLDEDIDFLQKPFSVQSLAEKVRDVLNG